MPLKFVAYHHTGIVNNVFYMHKDLALSFPDSFSVQDSNKYNFFKSKEKRPGVFFTFVHPTLFQYHSIYALFFFFPYSYFLKAFMNCDVILA